MKPLMLLLISFTCFNISYSQDDVSYMTSREQLMLKELNMARTKPLQYAAFISSYQRRNGCTTGDCAAAALELKAKLARMQPIPPLRPSKIMYKVAKAHADTFDRKNVKHSKSGYAENISVGCGNVRDCALGFLIDYGIPNRGHRKTILNPNYRAVGIYEGKGGCFIQEFSYSRPEDRSKY